ncbi:hypothetical protein RclHR1_08350005 [Rhizophagus clarus]|uniref:DNA-directed DNA polymerase n=1 Tax=Rhizophagus clarus TaxID=94130 RepID=A0A2Z6SBN4_9GLOM|nr:hypothetical protein RclHR1_08350005 [Rhizophagus clarus]
MYIDSHDRFKETELPLIHEFHNTLKDEYHNLYLKTDVLNLADVWTEFRKMSIEYYELDSSHYVSAPSLTWDGMLKMTGTYEYLKDLPPVMKNVAIEKDWLCPYNAKLVEQLDGERFSITEKLVPHLGPRKNYVIHYQELQYYIKLGIVVDEVSEILSFDQTNWLESYITFNTEKRNEAKKAGNTFLSDFFKLMNVSVYGKTMENVHKYQDIKIMKNNNEQNEKAFLKKVRSPRFKYNRLIGLTLIGAHMGKASVTLNEPIIVRASVLELSKLHMYEFWYGYVKEKYGDKSQLGYMNTDSFIYHVETENIYKDMVK